MSERMERENLLARWLAGELTPQELAELREREDYPLLKRLAEESRGVQLPGYPVSQEWERLRGKLSDSPARPSPVRRLWPIAIGAGVALLLAAVFAFPLLTQRTYEMADKGSITLPDGSQVTLNQNSSLAYRRQLLPSVRQCTLEGEAFFRVTHGRAFRVKTPQGQVEVRGTAFSVWARSDLTVTICYAGKVRVRNRQQHIDLEPGDRAQIIGNHLTGDRINPSNEPGWMQDERTFQNAPLYQVFAEWSQQTRKRIIGNYDPSKRYTGPLPQNPETAKAIFEDAMNLQIDIRTDSIVINRR